MMILFFKESLVLGRGDFRAARVENPEAVPPIPPFSSGYACYWEAGRDVMGNAMRRVIIDRRCKSNAPKAWGVPCEYRAVWDRNELMFRVI